MQEQRQPPKSCVSSSLNLHAGVSNNTKEAVASSICRGRFGLPYGLDQKPDYADRCKLGCNPLDQSFDRRLGLVPVDYCGCQKEATPNSNTAERGADKSEAE
jgi:hypothetical protein